MDHEEDRVWDHGWSTAFLEHPDVQHLKRVSLITHDAQTFYLGLDFHFASQSNRYMERLQ